MSTTVALTCPTCGNTLEAVNQYYMQCHHCRAVYKRDFSTNGVQLDFIDNNLDQMATQMNRTLISPAVLTPEMASQRLSEDMRTLRRALDAQVSAAQTEQREIEALDRQIAALRENLTAFRRPVVTIPTRPDRFGLTLWLTWGFFAVLVALRANGSVDARPDSPFMRILADWGIAPTASGAYRLVTTLDVLTLAMLALVPVVIALYYAYRALQFREAVRDAATDLDYDRARLESQIEQMQAAAQQRRDALTARHAEIARLEADLRWHAQQGR